MGHPVIIQDHDEWMNNFFSVFKFSIANSYQLVQGTLSNCQGAAPTPVWTGPTVLSLFVLFVFFFCREREFNYNIKSVKSVWIFHKNPSMSKELGASPKVLLPSSPVLHHFLNAPQTMSMSKSMITSTLNKAALWRILSIDASLN